MDENISTECKAVLGDAVIMRKITGFIETEQNRLSFLPSLDDMQLADIYARLSNGESLVSTSSSILDSWFPERSSELKGLVGELAKFKFQVLTDQDVLKSQIVRGDKDAAVTKKRLEDIGEKIDGMGRLAWLINTQTDRVNSLVDIEKKSLPLQTTDTAVKLLGGLLKDYINFQIETQEITRAPQEHIVRVENNVNAYLAQTVQNDGEAMAETALRLIAIAKERTLQLEETPQGCYVCPDLQQIELPEVEEIHSK